MSNFNQVAFADYLFPVTFADILPLDVTEALPLPDVEFIGMGDTVVYERINEWGAVERRFYGTVVAVDYATDRALIDSPAECQSYWCSADYLSLVKNGAANQAAFAA